MTISASENKSPQLIDREIFFGNPEYSGAQISPDGKYLAFIKPLNDVRNIWIKLTEESFDNAKPLTDEIKRPIPGYFWSRDSKFILFVKDNDGDENFNVYAVNPNEKPADGKEVPAAVNLTNAEKVTTQIYAVPETEPDFIYIGINDRDEAWHDLYKVQISTGEKTLIRENKDRLMSFFFDNKDKLRLALRSSEGGDTEILKVDGEEFTKVYTCGVFETCYPLGFNKDDRLVYLQTNKGERDLIQLVLFDPETQEETFVEQDPKARADLRDAFFSELTKELILTSYEDEKIEIYFRDKSFEADYNWLKAQLPNKEIGIGSLTKDENLWIISAYSDTEPGETFLFDRTNKNLTLQYKIRETLPREALAEMKPIRYKSSDGLEIPGYLTLPKGVEAKNLPLIALPHGGPWHRDSWSYNAIPQFLANRGYAVLQMNFRGSTGFGKKFIDGGNKQWGDLMQDDITWGVKHLIELGIADENRIAIMGGSYGGYATLAGVTFTPELYAAAVAIVAPSNLNTLLNSIPPYWESFRKVFLERMGDPSTPEGKEQLDRQSPLNHVEKIKTPLMVVQGANDPRVKKAESDQIVIALRERNYPVVYLLAEDEGHGFQRPVNNMAMFAEAEKFLAKHLGGRFQEDMKPDVETRLSELMIDVETVKMPEKIDLNAAPEINLSGKWQITASMMGQEISVMLDLTQDGASFTGKTSSMFGNGTVENGIVSGENFTGTLKSESPQIPEISIEGKLVGGEIQGNLSGGGLPAIPFTAVKEN